MRSSLRSEFKMIYDFEDILSVTRIRHYKHNERNISGLKETFSDKNLYRRWCGDSVRIILYA
jgi:hypothetical protein